MAWERVADSSAQPDFTPDSGRRYRLSLVINTPYYPAAAGVAESAIRFALSAGAIFGWEVESVTDDHGGGRGKSGSLYSPDAPSTAWVLTIIMRKQ